MLKEDFARRLRETIDQSDKSISDVALRSKIAKGLIYRYLDPLEKAMPTCYNLVNLCKELHVSADYLLFGEERANVKRE